MVVDLKVMMPFLPVRFNFAADRPRGFTGGSNSHAKCGQKSKRQFLVVTAPFKCCFGITLQVPCKAVPSD
jgi:hypothetical protein